VQPCANPASTDSCHPLKIVDLSQVQADALAAFFQELAGMPGPENPGPPCDDVSGHICTIAGVGISGNLKSAHLMARQAYLFWPQNVTYDLQGRVIIVDWNNFLLRRIEKDGCMNGDCPITTILGDGTLSDVCTKPGAPAMATRIGNNHNITV